MAVLELKDTCSIGTLDMAIGNCSAEHWPAVTPDKPELLAQNFTGKLSQQVLNTACGSTAMVAGCCLCGASDANVAVVMRHVWTRCALCKVARHNTSTVTFGSA